MKIFAKKFSPLHIPNCGLWLESSKGVTLVDSAVSNWKDSSGHNRNAVQDTSTKRPTYTELGLNGRPTLTFTSATSQRLNITSGLDLVQNVGGFTAFCVCQTSSLATAQTALLVCANTTSTYRINMSRTTGNQYQLRGRITDANSAATILSTSTYGTDPLIISGIYDCTNADMFQYINGVGEGSPNLNYGTAGNTSDTASAALYIGSLTSSQYWNGYIAEIIIYTRALSSYERKKIESRLGYKYNIAVS